MRGAGGGQARSRSRSHDPDRHDEQPGATGRPARRPARRGQRANQARSRSDDSDRHDEQPATVQPRTTQAEGLTPWKTERDPDTAPQVGRFTPRRPPGPQLDAHAAYTPKELFMLYFTSDTMETLCVNTNKHAALKIEMRKKYKWVDVDAEEMAKFIGLLLYTELVRLPCLGDYWKVAHILSVPLPGTVMLQARFRSIMWNLHPSDPEEDVRNDARRGTPEHDALCRVKPLIRDIREACKAHYHPKRALSVAERTVAETMVARNVKTNEIETRSSGLKLFVLADSDSGYALNFNVYGRKSHKQTTKHGMSYDAVIDLIHPSYLGTGYHIYVNDFHTSPKLLQDLMGMKFGACGAYRENGVGCPRGRENGLTEKSERGSIRWIREESLLFVKWMDTQEVVSVCSTIHPAVTPGDTVQRRVKEDDGRRTVKAIPCPTPIIAYNKHMVGGVDLCNQLLPYHSTLRGTLRWYHAIFYHFVEIATTNAYILHRERSEAKQEEHMSHKDFLAELVGQLCGVDVAGVPVGRKTEHVPVPVAVPTEVCQQCNLGGKRSPTAWKCKCCDVALCVICFAEWHS